MEIIYLTEDLLRLWMDYLIELKNADTEELPSDDQ